MRKKVNSSRIKGKGYEKIVQKGVQTAHKHMERCSGSFIIKDMQVEWNKQTSIRLTNSKFDKERTCEVYGSSIIVVHWECMGIQMAIILRMIWQYLSKLYGLYSFDPIIPPPRNALH